MVHLTTLAVISTNKRIIRGQWEVAKTKYWCCSFLDIAFTSGVSMTMKQDILPMMPFSSYINDRLA